MKDGDKYFIITTEWVYPKVSGCSVKPDIYRSRDEAVDACVEICEDEIGNYSDHTDPLPVGRMVESNGVPFGACITAKNGLDEWWFEAKVREMTFGTT